MNYYARHIGDWIGDTVNLTMLEDGAYNRLIDQYYRSEKPLPLDSKELFRLARASSSAERKAVLYVISAFFVRTESGFTQKRAQAGIEQFWERDQAAEGKRENDRERQQRARDRRKQLFEELRSHGIVPEFNTPTKQLALELSRVTKRDITRDDHAIVTRDNTATQAPVANPQTPDIKTLGDRQPVGTPIARAKPAELSAAMRRHSIEAQPGDPRVIAAADAGISVETVEAACGEAKSARQGQRINAGYVLTIAERWTREASQPRPAPNARASPQRTPSYHDERAATIAALTGANRNHEPSERDVIDVNARLIE